MVWNVVIWSSLASVCWIVGKQTIPEIIELFTEYAKGGERDVERPAIQQRRAS